MSGYTNPHFQAIIFSHLVVKVALSTDNNHFCTNIKTSFFWFYHIVALNYYMAKIEDRMPARW